MEKAFFIDICLSRNNLTPVIIKACCWKCWVS